MTLFRLSTDDERASIRNNVMFNAGAPGTLELGTSAGIYDFFDNWIRTGYVTSFDGDFSGTVMHVGTLGGDEPGFRDRAGQDYRPVAGSALENRAGGLAPAVLPGHDVVFEYLPHQAGVERITQGRRGLGAFEIEKSTSSAAKIPFIGPLASTIMVIIVGSIGTLNRATRSRVTPCSEAP